MANASKWAGPCWILLAVSLTAQDTAPPSTYEWMGDCPEPRCAYNLEWTARRDTPAWREPAGARASETPAFTIRAGERVRALTGTLAMLAPGVAVMQHDFSTDASYESLSPRHRQTITLLAGERVHLLAPKGDGLWRIWRRGRIIDANLYAVATREACAAAATRCAGVIEREPVTRWSVMVMNEQKAVGWIDEPRAFRW